MATPARQSKTARKGPVAPDNARRPAWTGARASPTFSPASPPPPRQQISPAPPSPAAFPSLAQANGNSANPRERMLQSLSGLTGTTILLITKSAQRYEGVVLSITAEGEIPGVTLKDVKEISTPGAPLKDSLFIASTNIDTWSSGPADAPRPSNGDSFRTDTDISQNKGNSGRERELQAWMPSNEASAGGDEDTFGLGSSSGGGAWDQFAVNEQKFGITTSFNEEVYTTKLDRSAADFKERERKAQRIANEILGTTTNNPHIAEERGLQVDDSGANEEDKYGAVVRGQNAYVPPGARRGSIPLPGGPVSPPPANNAAAAPAAAKPSADVPKLSVNGPDGATVQTLGQSPVSSKAPSPAPQANKPPADPLPAFRDFVTNEKQRLTQKRQALVKSEMDKRMAELVKFSQSFKLNKPIPEDLVPILAKDEDKRRQIKEKAEKDAISSQARTIGASTPATASRGIPGVGAKISSSKPPTSGAPPPSKQASNVAPSTSAAIQQQKATPAVKPSAPASSTAKETSATKKSTSMVIQAIPPFRGSKPRENSNGVASSSTSGANLKVTPPLVSAPNVATSPVSPGANNRLNVNASSFRPTTKASAVPSGNTSLQNANANASASASASVSPKPKDQTRTPSTPNPFFGARPIKKSAPVHIKDDFNPFKYNKVTDPAQVAPMWPYSGKRYSLMFPQPQHQPPQHATHMVPPGPPPMPPPSYEEDSAAQAAARGYVYAYPPYGYPGQPMMPGMPPQGPPGAYMPGPFMQPMPYPPGMPPPNAMYSPAMGQMPPPQAYMPPPPPGAYPPPPNGAGPRPSMPPTPIPAHAHPYYHQSPQLQHAVPYPMMMPPPPNVAAHPYDGGPAPPVQMGGHA